MKISWLGHSCFTVETEGLSVVLDPYQNGYVPGLGPLQLTADAVFCSHDHNDHNAVENVRISGREVSVSVEILESYHDENKGKLRGMNKIHILELENMKVAHLGDLGDTPTPEIIEKLINMDVVMIPVGGYYTINAKKAEMLLERINPRITIPMHYRGKTFGYDVLGTVEDFLVYRKDVVRYDGNYLNIVKETRKQTAVLNLN